jgi:Ca2+-binding RTX toxin-like protein
MIPSHLRHLVLVILLGLISSSIMLAFAANNAVPVTHLADQSRFVTANDLKPAACAGITLTAILSCPPGGGVCSGTDASELVIGSTADDDIDAGKGDDCILAGGGNDQMRGEQGTDVCSGGPGTDSFHPSCETEIQ